ncbi:PH domain-containing protein [Putridiphycobacter roseus]|uniref:PH domain-containing protein n=1 Tax=Putridiphycobacter roseus TaxID=2219161 RepID=A0A2W1NCY3_9FLAO|nr:PH domain-containing protein [Putridiphycobacter roseus]PZE15936.1 PH domain-containing protein [Putridiphycobacter roseus]
MAIHSTLVQKATFNESIKTYILWLVAFFLAITIVGIPLLLIWFLGLGQYISKRYYENLSCQLTDRHLEFKKGVLFKVEKTIPLENIQDLTFLENPILNYLDLKILKIETAGHSNPQGSDMKLIGIVNSVDFKEKVLNQRELLKTAAPSNSNQAFGDNDQIVGLLTDIKAILNAIKDK